MKKLVFLLPIFFFVFGCVVVVGKGGCYHLKKKSFNVEEQSKFIIKKPITLKVKTRGFIKTVYVTPSNNNELEVNTKVNATASVNFDDFRVKVEENNGTIFVHSVFKPEKNGISVCNLRGISEIRIKIPSNVEKIVYDTSSTDLKCNGVNINTIKIDTSSGDTYFEKCNIENLKADTSSGDVFLKNVEADSLNVDTSSGDLIVENCKITDFNGNTSSGDIVFNSFNKIKTTEIDTSSGDCKSNSILKLENASISTASGDIVLKLKPFKKIKIDTSSGDVKLSFQNVNNTYIYAKTSSGDFSIGFPLPDGVSIKDNVLEVGKGKNSILKISTGSGDISLSSL